MQDTNRTPIQERSAEIDAAAREWLNRYNQGAAPDKTFAAERTHCGLEFIERCQKAGLNPMMESVTAYPAWDKNASQWKLVFIPALETLLQRAEATGHFTGSNVYTRIREDKKVMCVAEVTRIVVPPAQTGLPSMEKTHRAEGSVDGWNAQCGRSPFWKSNPEWMTANAVLRAALKRAFPDVLSDLTAFDEAPDGDRGDDGPRPTTTGPAPKPAEDLGAAARAVLAGASAGATKPPAEPAATTTAAAPPAPAPAPAPARESGAQAAAREVQRTMDAAAPASPTGPALDPEIAAALPSGFTAIDLVDFLHRWDGRTLATLKDGDKKLLLERILPRGPATKVCFDECETLRQAFLAMGKHTEDWDALATAATKDLPFPTTQYAPRTLLQEQAIRIIVEAEPIVRKGV